MNPLLWLFDQLINLYIWIVIGQAILSLLVSFGIVNARQPIVAAVGEFFYRATEPALMPIRRRLPDLGPIDISPVILILGLSFLRYSVHWAWFTVF